MNDHDPNEDVLSIDPASVTGLDPGFGTVSITDDGQRLTVRVAPGATGTATLLVRRHRRHRRERPPVRTDLGHPHRRSDGGMPPRSGAGSRVPRRPGRRRRWRAAAPSRCRCCPAGSTPRAIRCCCCRVENPSGGGRSPRRRAATSSTSTATAANGGEELIELIADRHRADTAGQIVHEAAPRAGLAAAAARPCSRSRVVDTIDAGLTVDVAPHVTGTAGAISLESVRVLDDAAATATVVGGTTTFDFAARVARHVPRRTSRSPTARRRHRHRAHHDPARRRAAAARDSARRRLRPSAGGRHARRLRGGLEPDPARAAAQRRRRARGCRGHPLGRRASVRTTCASRARPPRVPRDASGP